MGVDALSAKNSFNLNDREASLLKESKAGFPVDNPVEWDTDRKKQGSWGDWRTENKWTTSKTEWKWKNISNSNIEKWKMPEVIRPLSKGALAQLNKIKDWWEVNLIIEDKYETNKIMEQIFKIWIADKIQWLTINWKINELPPQISLLKNITFLDVKNAWLDNLNDLSNLKQLRQLNVSWNNFKTLPKLPKSLSLLNISKNPNIKELPRALWELSSLNTINISDTPNLKYIPAKLAKLNPNFIFNDKSWLKDLLPILKIFPSNDDGNSRFYIISDIMSAKEKYKGKWDKDDEKQFYIEDGVVKASLPWAIDDVAIDMKKYLKKEWDRRDEDDYKNDWRVKVWNELIAKYLNSVS